MITKLSIGIFAFVLVSVQLKKKIETPPGTILLSEKLFVDQTEVSNFSWLEYLYWIKKHHGKASETYKKALPDTTVWSEAWATNNMNYLRHPSFRDYPVVGISVDQASAFCEWRSDRVNQYLYIRDHKLPITYGDSIAFKFPKRYRYSLPTKKQWIELTQIPYSDRVSKRATRKKLVMGNYANSSDRLVMHCSKPVKSYYPNEKGLYNIFGNVAELVSDYPVAMGGSWRQDEIVSKSQKGQSFNKVSNWIGFRCVAYEVE